MEDEHNVLRMEQPFAYQITKAGHTVVSWYGKTVKTLNVRETKALQALLDAGDAYQVQLFLAKATGNFKRGNER